MYVVGSCYYFLLNLFQNIGAAVTTQISEFTVHVVGSTVSSFGEQDRAFTSLFLESSLKVRERLSFPLKGAPLGGALEPLAGLPLQAVA